ncbi:hypothetical protein KXR87_07400 [Yokenella regensburgei]|uniref:hypothetical protein n=1 Tax=Yokenella regensburgei TaxID=158877 RepID=UPI003F18941F
MSRVIKALFILFLVLNGYVFWSEYPWYRTSTVSMARVSGLQVTSSAERQWYDTCTYFRGRKDCSAQYAYDVSWRAGAKTWHWHVDKARLPPDALLCMHVVQNRPAIAKPCDDLFFIPSRIPALIMAWAILAFVSFTWLIHRFARRRRAQRLIFRVCTPKRQLLLETEDGDEAQRFIGDRYRVCATFRTCERVRSGRKMCRVDCITYHVRQKKGP